MQRYRPFGKTADHHSSLSLSWTFHIQMHFKKTNVRNILVLEKKTEIDIVMVPNLMEQTFFIVVLAIGVIALGGTCPTGVMVLGD